MLSQSSASAQYVMNTRTGEIGLVTGVMLSPYTFEALNGVERIQVTVFIPSSSGTMFEGRDYWSLEDCAAVPNAQIEVGTEATIISKRGTPRTGVILAAHRTEICVMLPDGLTGWVYFSRVASVAIPATNAAAATNAFALIA